MKLYYHKTDGGAEYLFDTFIKCQNGHKEGAITPKTKYIVRIDGDIKKDAELNIREEDEEEGETIECGNCGREFSENEEGAIVSETINRCPRCANL